MHFYSESFKSVMEMPISVFWILSGNVERIQAQEDGRLVRVTSASGINATSESLRKFSQILIEETGSVIVTKFDPIANAVRDQKGFDELKLMLKE